MQTIHIVEDNLPMAWERAVIECWEKGSSFRTEYDKPGDPKSKDVTLMLHIKNPFAEPRFHKCMPMGLNDLEKYIQEVVNGVHNSWIAPEEGKWSYTYNSRLFEYEVPISGKINQISDMIKKLKETPYTRRARAITWQPWQDYSHGDPPCLQSLAFRAEKNTCEICNGNGEVSHGLCSECEGIGTIDKLNMSVVIRSNDAYKAAFGNLIAFTELQKTVADELGIRTGEVSYYAESFHIYGSYFKEFEGFLKQVEKTIFEQRVWTTQYAIPMFLDGLDELLKEEDMAKDKKDLIYKRIKYLENVLNK